MTKTNNATPKDNKNLKISVKGDNVTITMSLKAFKEETFTQDDLSSTGKSYVLASTHGTKSLEGDKLEGLSLGLNLFVPRKAYDERQAQKLAKKQANEASEEIAVAKELQGLSKSDLKALIELAKSLKK
jgi:hypothetical protein